MDAKELRIGNWVNYGIPEDNVDIEMGLVEFDEKTIKNLLLPIPITVNWLKRFWFNKTEYGHEIKISRKTFIVSETDQDDILVLYSPDIGLDFCKLTFIEFVHELQNLIFALTGKELTIWKQKK